MKKLSIFSALIGLFFCGAASAADITLYYSPFCPHCHHARDFFVNRIVYEYPKLRVPGKFTKISGCIGKMRI